MFEPDGGERPIPASVSGEVLVALHRVGILAEPGIWSNSLDYVVFVRGRTHVHVSFGDMELTHVLNARAG